MKITDICINGIENATGYCCDYLVCSWKIKESISQKQKYAKIEVSKSENFEDIIYTCEGEHLRSSGECLEFIPESRTIYYLRISVTGDQGDCAVSDLYHFETGKMNETWDGEWIATQKQDQFHPKFRKKIKADKSVKYARMYISGVGLFEAYWDGKKIGNEYLTPYLTNYETNIQAITLKLPEVTEGEHTLEVLLGKGWYMGVYGLEDHDCNYGNRMAMIGELVFYHGDGTETHINTDASWEYQGSDIEDSGIYFGETLNRQLWKEKENCWKKAEVLRCPEKEDGTKNLKKSHIMDRLSVPVIEKERISVKEIIKTPKGETVLDFGQNFAGFVEFLADFPEGTKIVLDFGEILQNGNFYNKNYRTARSEMVYISDGKKEKVRPHFTFFGFRYCRVTGWPGEVRKEDFEGKVLYSDIRRTGYLHTSDEKINRLYENTVWGMKSNFIDMPTDCPQRSERLGWTGDAQVFAPTASYHMDTRAFYHKFVKDLKDEQAYINGAVPNYLPNIGHKDDAGSVWGDVATFLPQTVYHYFGNLQDLEYSYPLMKKWVDYIDRKDAEREKRHYLFDFGFHFGDWLALDGPTPTSYKGGTDDTFIASNYYYQSAKIVADAAGKTGREEDARHYDELAEHIRQAVLNEYYTPNGRLALDTQAAYVVALKFGVYIDKERLIRQFQERLKKDGYKIKCGFVGAPLLCTVLAECGLYETAYDFLLNEEFPGWLYEVNLGATTVWERWNSVNPDGTITDTGMNSLNHYAYGSVMEFVYGYVGGIRALQPGFKEAVIAPHPDIRIPEVQCRYDSVNGEYVCEWKIKEDGNIYMKVEIPFDCKAQVVLPGTDKVLNLQSGVYEYDYKPEQNYRMPYGKESTLARLEKNKEAMKILKEDVPALAEMAEQRDPEWCFHTLEEFSHMHFINYEPDKLQDAIEKIGKITV